MSILQQWSPEQYSAFGTMATAVVAVVAAAFAYLQVRHSRQLREDQARPFVVVDFEVPSHSSHLVYLVIENMGQTLARNVKVTFSPDLESASHVLEGYPLAESTLLKNGIPSLPPGRRITALFDHAVDRFNADLPMSYEATVMCEDAHGKAQDPLKYTLDLSFLYGLLRTEERGMHDAAKALMAIEKTIKQWGEGAAARGLTVYVRDGDERDKRRRASSDEQMNALQRLHARFSVGIADARNPKKWGVVATHGWALSSIPLI